MVIISDKDREFLKKHIDNVDELIKCETAGPLLDEIDDIIMYKGFEDDQDALNEFGLAAQEIRDKVWWENHKV